MLQPRHTQVGPLSPTLPKQLHLFGSNAVLLCKNKFYSFYSRMVVWLCLTLSLRNGSVSLRVSKQRQHNKVLCTVDDSGLSIVSTARSPRPKKRARATTSIPALLGLRVIFRHSLACISNRQRIYVLPCCHGARSEQGALRTLPSCRSGQLPT